MKGQGTIEYLVILAVIVVISLIVVSLMINSTEPAGNISSGVDKISAQTGWIAVSDAVADSEGDAVITLSPKENVTIKTVTIEGEEYVIPDTKVFAGNSQPILLSGLPPCSSGTSSYTIDLISGVNDNDLPVAVSDIRISVECIENVSEDSITNDNYIEGTIFIPTYTLSDCAVLDSKGFYNLEADITNVDDTCFEIIGSDITLNGNGHKISFANKGTGNFYLFDSLTSTQRPWGVSSGDLDNDGDLDLVFANLLAEESFLNDGKANFINTGFLGNGGNQADNIILGDFDGDGFLDYITAGWWTNNQLYLGDGTGFFDWSWTDSLGAKTHSLCIGDFDNDGDLDHFSADYDQYSSTDGLVYLNNGDGTFTPGWGAPSGYTYSAESTDFDKDGNLDLVVGSYSGPAITYVFLGDGTGGFSLSWSTPHQSRDVAIGDFDGDGYQDFVGTIFNDKSLIQFGDGTGQFSNDVNINGTGSTFEIGVADFDGDGDLDLLVGRNNQTNIIYENDVKIKDFSLTKYSGGGSILADVVFVLDVSGSMGDEIDQVRTYLGEFGDSLQARGYDFKIGVVTFSTTVDHVWEFTDDIEQIRQNLASISLWGGIEDSPAALYRASELNFRAGSRRTIIWITDEPYPEHSYTKEQIVNRMLSMDITVHGVGLTNLQTEWFNPIVLPTSGNFYNITGNFRDILLDVARLEAQDKYQITYTSPVEGTTLRQVLLKVHYAGLGGSAEFNYSPPTQVLLHRRLSCFPNPFNPEIKINISELDGLQGEVAIYNLLGERIRQYSLTNESYRQIIWNAHDESGRPASTGFYLVQLSLLDSRGRAFRETQKILYLK